MLVKASDVEQRHEVVREVLDTDATIHPRRHPHGVDRTTLTRRLVRQGWI